MQNVIDLSLQRVWLDEEGIVHVVVKPGAAVELAHAKEAVNAVGALWAGIKRPTVIDMRELRSIARDARTYFAGPQTAAYETAVALIVRSPLTRTIGNFFLAANKQIVPCRMFNDDADAIVWLRQFRLAA